MTPGGEGDDYMEWRGAMSTTATASQLPVLRGGSGADVIYLLGGAGRVEGGDGDDLIVGSAFGDVLDGGTGNDEIRGQTFPDAARI